MGFLTAFSRVVLDMTVTIITSLVILMMEGGVCVCVCVHDEIEVARDNNDEIMVI